MSQTTQMRQVTWGEGVLVEVFKVPGGLKLLVDVITSQVGRHIGTRNTFAKLYQASDPSRLGERDMFRAWLLLAALDEDPLAWGISDDVVPRSIDRDSLRQELSNLVRHQGLEPRTR